MAVQRHGQTLGASKPCKVSGYAANSRCTGVTAPVLTPMWTFMHDPPSRFLMHARRSSEYLQLQAGGIDNLGAVVRNAQCTWEQVPGTLHWRNQCDTCRRVSLEAMELEEAVKQRVPLQIRIPNPRNPRAPTVGAVAEVFLVETRQGPAVVWLDPFWCSVPRSRVTMMTWGCHDFGRSRSKNAAQPI